MKMCTFEFLDFSRLAKKSLVPEVQGMRDHATTVLCFSTPTLAGGGRRPVAAVAVSFHEWKAFRRWCTASFGGAEFFGQFIS